MKVGDRFKLGPSATAEQCGVEQERFDIHIKGYTIRILAKHGPDKFLCMDAVGNSFSIHKDHLKDVHHVAGRN